MNEFLFTNVCQAGKRKEKIREGWRYLSGIFELYYEEIYFKTDFIFNTDIIPRIDRHFFPYPSDTG